MIANAGQLGLDWRFLSLSAYFEALEAHNDAQSGDKPGPAEVSPGLKSFMKAHGVGDGGNGAAPAKPSSTAGASRGS